MQFETEGKIVPSPISFAHDSIYKIWPDCRREFSTTFESSRTTVGEGNRHGADHVSHTLLTNPYTSASDTQGGPLTLPIRPELFIFITHHPLSTVFSFTNFPPSTIKSIFECEELQREERSLAEAEASLLLCNSSTKRDFCGKYLFL